jgi:hypothetical protein
MKLFQAWLLSSLWASTLAAPAVVWKKNRKAESRSLHSSDSIAASDLMQHVLEDVPPSDSSLASVVFLVNKGQNGSESLTELASSGKLPETANKYSDAAGIYHQVSGIESTPTMVRETSRANNGHGVLQVSLSELNIKMTSSSEASMDISETGAVTKTTSKRANKRARDIAKSNVLVVLVEPNDNIDRIIADTIDNENVDTVVLAAIRSIDEVKRDRYVMSKHRHDIMANQGKRALETRRRRLDEQDGDEDGNNDNDDMTGVYYVHMTPNILSGLLFGFFFVTVTYIGIGCMGAINSQDVYVKEMPTIGREA